MAFRVLGAGNFPKHRTLCDFRALHLQELAALFVQVVKLARECGLIKLGTIAVDGTKVKASASRHKAMSYKRMPSASTTRPMPGAMASASSLCVRTRPGSVMAA